MSFRTWRSFRYLPSTRFLAVTPGGGNRDFGPCGHEKTVPRTAFDSRTGRLVRDEVTAGEHLPL
jgi:hypothetical protein